MQEAIRRAAAEPPADEVSAPSAFMLLLEARALWEYGASLAAMPWLKDAPRGDGHPVLVLPGLAANDVSTYPLRQFLRERGYLPEPWNYGFNFGPQPGILTGCIEHVKELHKLHGRKVSLLGWSLGGIRARDCQGGAEVVALRHHPRHAVHRQPEGDQRVALVREGQQAKNRRSQNSAADIQSASGADYLALLEVRWRCMRLRIASHSPRASGVRLKSAARASGFSKAQKRPERAAPQRR